MLAPTHFASGAFESETGEANLERLAEVGRELFALECLASSGDGALDLDGNSMERAQQALLEALEPGVTVVFEFDCGRSSRGGVLWRVEAVADSARPVSGDYAISTALLSALASPRMGYVFQSVVPRQSTGDRYTHHLRPGVDVIGGLSRGAIGFRPSTAEPTSVRIPRRPTSIGGEMDAVLRVLVAEGAAVRLRCEVRRLTLPGAPFRCSSGDHGLRQDSIVAWLDAARTHRSSIALDARLLSDVPIDPANAARASHCLFGSSPRSTDPEPESDTLVPAFHERVWMPTIIPSARLLGALGLPTFLAPVSLRLPEDGVIIGRLPGARTRLVRLPGTDRSRHCYAIGGTGTGKSTLLLNMLESDMHAGRGVCLIDPHGDLFSEAVCRVPVARTADVVLINPYDEDFSVGLNVMQFMGARKDIGPTVVSNRLIALFDRLYDLGKVGGPVFECFMRNAVLLVLGTSETSTVLDIVRVFEDSEYRKRLVGCCTDSSVATFWKEQAEKAGGDLSLRNVAPYITSKLNQFISNHLVRPMVTQPVSTVHFDAVLNNQQIVLVNLAVGHLGAMDSRFIGMLLLDKIFEAAVSFVGARRSDRRPFHLYLDEFHDFAGPTLEVMLSAGRKFGLRLTLAHQTLSQLSSNRYGSRLVDAVMSNTGSKLIMRVGGQDAEVLARELGGGVSAAQLQSLPDFHAMAKLLSAGRSEPPFVFETLEADAPRGRVATYAELLALRSTYATPSKQPGNRVCVGATVE